jgi:hypothetical protein
MTSRTAPQQRAATLLALIVGAFIVVAVVAMVLGAMAGGA